MSLTDFGQYQPITDFLMGLMKSVEDAALKIGGLLFPQNPTLGAIAIFLIGLYVLKSKGEGMWTWIIIGIIVAFFLLR